MEEIEIWKEYKTYHVDDKASWITCDLEISNLGNVRGVVRGHPVKIYYNSVGRRTISPKGRHNCIYLLVWKAFNGPIPEGYCIHHIDGNKLNDRLDNLELLTRSEHSQHHANGKNHPNFGKRRSNETKEKIKQSNIGKHNHNGKNNPSYGNHKKFYNNGTITKRFASFDEAASLGYVYEGIAK